MSHSPIQSFPPSHWREANTDHNCKQMERCMNTFWRFVSTCRKFVLYSFVNSFHYASLCKSSHVFESKGHSLTEGLLLVASEWLIHGMCSAASEAVCLGLPAQCNSAGPAADPGCLHIQKWIFLWVFTVIPRDVLGLDPDPLVRQA